MIDQIIEIYTLIAVIIGFVGYVFISLFAGVILLDGFENRLPRMASLAWLLSIPAVVVYAGAVEYMK